MPDPLATQTLAATWIGSVASLFAAVSALWIAHRTNVDDHRRRQKKDREQRRAFGTAVKLAIRKLVAMTHTIADTGDGALTRKLFVSGIKSAQGAIAYALRLGVADADLLVTAFDAQGAFDLLAASFDGYGDDQFAGAALAATRADLHDVVQALVAKHPSIAPEAGRSLSSTSDGVDKG